MAVEGYMVVSRNEGYLFVGVCSGVRLSRETIILYALNRDANDRFAEFIACPALMRCSKRRQLCHVGQILAHPGLGLNLVLSQSSKPLNC